MCLNSRSEVVTGGIEKLFESTDKETKSSYYRFKTFLISEQEAITNACKEKFCSLQALKTRLITERSQEIDKIYSHV
ncbi:MAG: hypothetical protein PUP92_00035 [Rhizonema sp. PD38]|nr:hypothetical protein [Rhizonema sp. PD38]